MCDEKTEKVQTLRGEPGSSVAVVQAAADTEQNDDDDGQELVGSPQVMKSVLPVHTLPEEIGLKIFEMLQDKDLASCFQTFPTWYQWLQPKGKPRFLFPEVAPFLLQWLPNSALLECRKVCRTWKEGLDNAYSLYPERLRIPLGAPRMPEFVNEFVNAHEIQFFLYEMEFHPGNPFLGRAVSIEWITMTDEELAELYGDDDDDYNWEIYFWDDVNQLLDRFGEHVFVFKITLDKDDFDPVEQILRDCLLRLPNLRRLEICADTVTSSYRIRDYYRLHPLPKLLHLQTLQLNAPDDITKAVLESCCVPQNIKQLAFSENDEEHGYGFYEAVYNFKNLEALDAKKKVAIEDFERLMLIPPPLKKLRLQVQNIIDNFIDFQRFFKTMEVLANSLESVEVQSNEAETLLYMRVVNDFKINLPKLKRLILFGYTGPLDPFLQLTSLNYLEIMFTVWRPWNGSKVLVYGLENRMKVSNIWTLLPTLKTLIIKGKDWRGFFGSRYKRNNAGKITGKFKGKRKIGTKDASLSLLAYEKVYGNKSEVGDVGNTVEERHDGNQVKIERENFGENVKQVEGVENTVEERHDGNQAESKGENFGENVKQVEDINESKFVCNNGDEHESESDEESGCSFWVSCMYLFC